MNIKNMFGKKEKLDDSIYCEDKYIEIADVLSHDVCVETFIDSQRKYKIVMGIWDTGAYCSCISKEVIKELGIKPVKTGVKTTSMIGTSKNDVYSLNVYLNNYMIFKNVEVQATSFEETKYQFIIGMDIIKQGNFQVLIEDDKTVVKFQRVKFD